ncbi:hypothetical protein DFJ73DRAFT_759602 [Zopfochytrium polystomum]|nr:hypothetical protein DFJ73DRAFT_759602 [Zopfochytrium polystomum]
MIHAAVSGSLGGQAEAAANPILQSFFKAQGHSSIGGASQPAQSEVGGGRLGELFQKAMTMKSSWFFSRSPSLRAAPTTVPIRPGADASEQDIFADLFFRRRINVVQVVHKMSYLRDKHRTPAFLQAAICAMGASDEAVKNLPQDVMMYYYEFARSQAMQWLDAPSLESLQALLILADVSLRNLVLGLNRYRQKCGCADAKRLCLQIDPDDLPQHFSRVEKEVRRRCWYLAAYIERYRTIATNRLECTSHSNLNAVKAMCSDSLWLSMDPQAVDHLEPLPKDSPVELFYQIFEVNLSTIKLISPSPKLSPSPSTKTNSNQMQDCLNKAEQWYASALPYLSMDIESLSAKLTMWALETNQEATPIRWHVAAICTYHASKLNLTYGVLSRILPTLLAPPNASTPNIGIPALQINAADRAALQDAFATAWASADAIAAVGTALDFLGVQVPVLAALPLFATAAFFALASRILAATPPLPLAPPPGATAAVAQQVLARMLASFERRVAERPMNAVMLAALGSGSGPPPGAAGNAVSHVKSNPSASAVAALSTTAATPDALASHDPAAETAPITPNVAPSHYHPPGSVHLSGDCVPVAPLVALYRLAQQSAACGGSPLVPPHPANPPSVDAASLSYLPTAPQSTGPPGGLSTAWVWHAYDRGGGVGPVTVGVDAAPTAAVAAAATTTTTTELRKEGGEFFDEEDYWRRWDVLLRELDLDGPEGGGIAGMALEREEEVAAGEG